MKHITGVVAAVLLCLGLANVTWAQKTEAELIAEAESAAPQAVTEQATTIG